MSESDDLLQSGEGSLLASWNSLKIIIGMIRYLYKHIFNLYSYSLTFWAIENVIKKF